jgi:antitoxin HicB
MKTPRNYLQQPYARIVIPVETSGFHAEILEFPGCFAQGETVEEAYTNLENAAESWIEVTLAQGHEVPEPSSTLTFSGRIALRLPKSIHRQAARMAERDETSLNTYLVSAVAAKVGVEDFSSVLVQRIEQRLATTISDLTRAAILAWNDCRVEQTSTKAEIRSVTPQSTAVTVSAKTSTAVRR